MEDNVIEKAKPAHGADTEAIKVLEEEAKEEDNA